MKEPRGGPALYPIFVWIGRAVSLAARPVFTWISRNPKLAAFFGLTSTLIKNINEWFDSINEEGKGIQSFLYFFGMILSSFLILMWISKKISKA